MSDTQTGGLVLSRYIGQSICIGDDIEVVLLSVNGNQAKIKIIANKDVAVHRREIYEKIQAEKLIAEKKSTFRNRLLAPFSTRRGQHE